VIAEVRKTFPNKPVRYLVNTHNQFDHLCRVRGFVAEGSTATTKTEPSTSGSSLLGSRGRSAPTIEQYHVDRLNHSDNMLVAYLPKEKIVVNAGSRSP
jgi:hypothetical protein